MSDQAMNEDLRRNAIEASKGQKVRKPVYCAHPLKQIIDQEFGTMMCGSCEGEWVDGKEEEPKVVIGYLEAE